MIENASPSPARKRRGRPTKANAEALGDSILRVAEELFLEDGFKAVTMEAVATRAGISKGTLYARYPGKAQLFLAIAADYKKRPRTRPPLPAPADFSDLRSWLAEVAVRLMKAVLRPNVIAYEDMVRSAARRFPKLRREMHDLHYPDNAALIRRALEEAAAHFSIVLADAEFTTDLILATIWGWARMEPQQGDPRPLPPAEAARRLGRAIADGLAMEAGREPR